MLIRLKNVVGTSLERLNSS